MTKIEHTGFTVTNLETSIQFYKKLGFKTLRKTSIPHAMLYLNDTVIELTQGAAPTGFHIALTTDNIEAYIAELNRQGIETSPIQDNQTPLIRDMKQKITETATPPPHQQTLQNIMTPNNNWKRTTLKDPDNIPIEIWQRK
jgi:catechol 2,3-dioxygenase-like lactoylglutathione lyase family enzyme